MSEFGHGGDNLDKGSSPGRDQRGISWQVKAILFPAMVLLGLLGHAMSGWGEPIAMAAAAVVVPVFLLQFRKFWGQTRFWITVSFLAVVQVPLVVATRPLIQQAGSFYMLGFGILDMMMVGAVILLVC
jgi:hypothetical protein